jgi:hypothetical protein
MKKHISNSLLAVATIGLLLLAFYYVETGSLLSAIFYIVEKLLWIALIAGAIYLIRFAITKKEYILNFLFNVTAIGLLLSSFSYTKGGLLLTVLVASIFYIIHWLIAESMEEDAWGRELIVKIFPANEGVAIASSVVIKWLSPWVILWLIIKLIVIVIGVYPQVTLHGWGWLLIFPVEILVYRILVTLTDSVLEQLILWVMRIAITYLLVLLALPNIAGVFVHGNLWVIAALYAVIAQAISFFITEFTFSLDTGKTPARVFYKISQLDTTNPIEAFILLAGFIALPGTIFMLLFALQLATFHWLGYFSVVELPFWQAAKLWATVYCCLWIAELPQFVSGFMPNSKFKKVT